MRPTDSRSKWLYKTSGTAALIAGILLLIGMINLINAGFQPGAASGRLSSFQDNWLILIFKLHAGFGGVQAGLLHVLNLLDYAILILVCMMCLGLYAALRNASRIWSLIALALPFLGIILLTATGIAGRSSVMAAVLIISLVMLRSADFNKTTAFMGILAGVFLLAGDFSVGVPQSNMIAALFGLGYLRLTAWFVPVGTRLFQLGRITLASTR